MSTARPTTVWAKWLVVWALANALQRRRYQMTFMSRIDNHAWPDRIRRHRHNVLRTNHAAGSIADRTELMREVETRQPQVVVTDSIEFDEEFLAMLSYGCRW